MRWFNKLGFVLALGISAATAQTLGPPSAGSGTSGTVTSITPGAGLVSSTTAACSQTAITGSGTVSGAECVNAQTGTTYAIVDGDRAKLITATNAAAQAYSIAQAGAASAFQAGWYTDISNLSTNVAGIVTVTPTTSTINGAATLKVQPGQSVRIVSDGANYQVSFLASGAQLPGTTTSDSANSGNVGESISASLASGAAHSLSTGTNDDIITLSVPAGDWDLQGWVWFNPSGASITVLQAWVSKVSITRPTPPVEGQIQIQGTGSAASVQITASTGHVRISNSAPTNVFLTAQVQFSGGTVSGYGILTGRRVR